MEVTDANPFVSMGMRIGMSRSVARSSAISDLLGVFEEEAIET